MLVQDSDFIFFGNTAVDLGMHQDVAVVYERTEYENQYLTFEFLDNASVFFYGGKYSFDSGATWTNVTNSNFNVSAGTVLWFSWGYVQPGDVYTGSTLFNNRFGGARFNVYGNILSAIYGDAFTAVTHDTGFTLNLNSTFEGSSVVDASGLVLPGGRVDMERMFMECQKLVYPPFSLRAEEISAHLAFDYCKSLLTTPEMPSTVLFNDGYLNTFTWCFSLKTACPIMMSHVGGPTPSTDIHNFSAGQCGGMYEDCHSLVVPSEMPNLRTGGGYSHHYMYSGCTSLERAPIIPALDVNSNVGSMSYMFYGCSKLKYVECRTFKKPSTTCWLGGVPSVGTFVKPAGMTSWIDGGDGIPYHWDVVNK